MSANRQPRQKGVILLIAISAVFILLIIAFALSAAGTRNLFQVLHMREGAIAYYAAQAGIQRSVYAVKTADSSLTCGSPVSPSFLKNQQLPDGGTFTMTVYSNASGAAGQGCVSPYLTASDGTGTHVLPGMIYVSGTGSVGSVSRVSSAMIQVARQSWRFPYVSFATGNVSYGSGSLSDSFNSNNGNYGGANIGSNGNIGTNASSNGAVSLEGPGTHISGRVDVGPAGSTTSTITVSGGATYDSAAVLSSPLLTPPNVDPLDGPGNTNINVTTGTTNLSPGPYGNVQAENKGTIVLTCGIYSIKQLRIANFGIIDADPACTALNPVQIYIYNSLQLSGTGILNSMKASPGLIIYGMPRMKTATIDTNAAFAMYAPNADIQVGGRNGMSIDFYGSLVGAEVSAEQANLHYDEALGLSVGGSNGFKNQATVKGWSSQY